VEPPLVEIEYEKPTPPREPVNCADRKSREKDRDNGPVTSEAAATPLPRRGRIWVILILAIAIGGLGYAIVEIATKPPGGTVVTVEGISEAQEIFGGVPQEGDRLGSEDSSVSIQVFTDLQCSSCRPEFLSTVPKLVEEEVRPGGVKLLLRHYSVSENPLELGAFGAEAAAQQGYGWQYTYLFFRNQPEVERIGRLTEDFEESLAGSIGELDVPEWHEYLEAQSGDGGEIKSTLEGYDELGGSLGIRTGLATIINGPRGTRTLQDGPSLGQIERAIEAVGES
jgi:Thioredoxin